jgi:hypothetical protein
MCAYTEEFLSPLTFGKKGARLQRGSWLPGLIGWPTGLRILFHHSQGLLSLCRSLISGSFADHSYPLRRGGPDSSYILYCFPDQFFSKTETRFR